MKVERMIKQYADYLEQEIPMSDLIDVKRSPVSGIFRRRMSLLAVFALFLMLGGLAVYGSSFVDDNDAVGVDVSVDLAEPFELLVSESDLGSGFKAIGHGTLRFDVIQRCVYLEDGAGRLAIRWPGGFTSSVGPFAVIDRSGVLVEVEGQEVVLGGGYIDTDTVSKSSRCGADGSDRLFDVSLR